MSFLAPIKSPTNSDYPACRLGCFEVKLQLALIFECNSFPLSRLPSYSRLALLSSKIRYRSVILTMRFGHLTPYTASSVSLAGAPLPSRSCICQSSNDVVPIWLLNCAQHVFAHKIRNIWKFYFQGSTVNSRYAMCS